MKATNRCIICARKPATNDKGFCANCQRHVDAQARRKKVAQPDKYIAFRGRVIALYHQPAGGYIATRCFCDVESLPKSKVIDITTYVPGYDRSQIKKMKAAIAQLA